MTVAIFRTMTAADLPDVLRLERELFPEDAWSEEMLRGELADQPRTRHYVVAESEDGELIGYAGLFAAGGQADVQTIGVSAKWRGGGIGGELLTRLLDEAERRGGQEVFLEVRADNPEAIRLYERFDFARVGIRRRYYQPSGVDAIVMRRHLRRNRDSYGGADMWEKP